MGIVPEIWGPYVWASIHLICLGAPKTLDVTGQQAYKRFFEQLPDVIPCYKCAQHLRQNLASVPLENALAGRDDLFEWSVKLHNLVNQQLQKPTMTLEDAKKHWSSIQPLFQRDVKQNEIAPNGFQSSGKSRGAILFIVGFVVGLILMMIISKLRRKK